MNLHSSATDPARGDAARIMDLVNTLSLFTRTTMVRWIPELVNAVDLTGERYMVLFELGLLPDTSLKDLAEPLGVSPSALSVMVQSLVERDLVTRVPDPTDRRRVVLRLSEAGEQMLSSLENELIDRFQDYLQTLEPADRSELADASRAMLGVVRRILGRDASPRGAVNDRG
jgi:DNA-binding MarR family transcriptional regulator